MAESLEPGDQAAGFAFGVQALGEVVGAELVFSCRLLTGSGISGGRIDALVRRR
jgi:hypothetical protein